MTTMEAVLHFLLLKVKSATADLQSQQTPIPVANPVAQLSNELIH